jgi:methylmalonyl-CoA mutase C-terminal domain/subunit
MTLFVRILDLLKEEDASNILIFGGGIIPEADRQKLLELGVGEIFTPGTPIQEIVDWLNKKLSVTPTTKGN